MDRLGPPMRGMEQRSSGSLGYVLDAIFGLSVLMMCVYSTKTQGLVACFDRRAEYFRIEKSIIGVVVLNTNAVERRHTFEG